MHAHHKHLVVTNAGEYIFFRRMPIDVLGRSVIRNEKGKD